MPDHREEIEIEPAIGDRHSMNTETTNSRDVAGITISTTSELTSSSASTHARSSEVIDAESNKRSPEEAETSNYREESEILLINDENSTNSTTASGDVNEELYKQIMLEQDTTKLQKVLLSSSYPSPISLKLQGIKEMLKDNKGRLNINILNFAIRILRREETIDRSRTNSKSLLFKCYISADFARFASYEEDGLSDLETCVLNDFAYRHHNGFGQDADFSSNPKPEVLCIPVVHNDSWSLYAFSISDQKLSILDPASKRTVGELVAKPDSEHEKSRLKICKALGLVQEKFKLFTNEPGDFVSWRYEFTDLSQFTKSVCNDEDSGFFVFYFMQFWDGHRLIAPEEIPKDPRDLRKRFLEYIVSSNYNEVYQHDDLHHVFSLMEKLKLRSQKASGPGWTRCKMDTELLKAVKENNVDAFDNLFESGEMILQNLRRGKTAHEFAKLFKESSDSIRERLQKRKKLLQNLSRGATCDGDGVLHIAARCSELKLLKTIFKLVHVQLNLDAIKRGLLEDSVRGDCVHVSVTIEEEEQQPRLVELEEFSMLLRSRNHKGETCLHEAVRRDNARIALSLILADEKIMLKDVPPLVQIVDYEGVSPLYLATTLCRSDIVRILTNKNNKYTASFSGPGAKTALHAAVHLNKELTELVLNWMKDVEGIPDLKVMADNSGNTPLHLLSAVGGVPIAELLKSGTAPKDTKESTALSPSTRARSSEVIDAESKKIPEEPQTSNSREERETTPNNDGNSMNSRTTYGEDAHDCEVDDELYKQITSEKDTTKLQKVVLSSTYPSPIRLKLQGIKEILEDNNGHIDIDTLNFAIRKLGREETIDRSPTNTGSLICKNYISADFVKFPINMKVLETRSFDEFAYYHHNDFAQDAELSGHPKKEVLYIPVIYHGRWSLYAINTSDQEISIFDPTENITSLSTSGSHKIILSAILKALLCVKTKFKLINPSKTASWSVEFPTLDRFGNCSNEDSGFVVFYFMRFLDGNHLVDTDKIPEQPKDLRKSFVEYILSFKYNEVYQFDDLENVFDLMEKIKLRAQIALGCHSWTRCLMDTMLFKAVRENDIAAFDKLLFEQSGELLQNLCRGATSDGDGVLHIASRCGDLELLRAIFKAVHVELNLDAIKRRMMEGSVRDVCVQVNIAIEEEERQQRLDQLQEFAELLRSRNHNGETCLHDAVRKGNALLVLSLILTDEGIMKDVNNNNNDPWLVQRVDYRGVSPLYLATKLGHSDIVGILTHKSNKCVASFSGPKGKTALHAAVRHSDPESMVLELTKLILNWMKDVDGIPDLRVMEDKCGNTPLYHVSARGGAELTELLLSWTKHGEGIQDLRNYARKPTCTALEMDSKGWSPIHVAAANAKLDMIIQLIKECPECLESRSASGQSFLHIAVEKKRRSVVQYVCSQQSMTGILNLTDRDGNTALHLAVKKGNQRIFCDLMGNPTVHLSTANREGHTPRDVAMLSLEPGLQFLLNSRILIYYHLKLSGAQSGICRRDLLKDGMGVRLDKDKLSKTIGKSAGLTAVCAMFLLNMSVTTFFNIAKQNLAPTDPVNASPEGRSARARARTFKALIAVDAVTFTSSLLTVFCSTFAGFSIMDRPTRFLYLRIAGFSLQIACMGLLAVFLLLAHLAFAPVDPRIATVACVLPVAAFTPQLMTPSILLILHAWTLSPRLLRKHVFPKVKLFFETYRLPIETYILHKTKLFFQTHIPAACFAFMDRLFRVMKGIMKLIWTCVCYLFTGIIETTKAIPKCCSSCCLPLLGVLFVIIGVGIPLVLVYIIIPGPE